jgi:hypothetical protein
MRCADPKDAAGPHGVKERSQIDQAADMGVAAESAPTPCAVCGGGRMRALIR